MRPASLLYNLHCRVCGDRLPPPLAGLCAACRRDDSAPSWWARFRALDPPTLRGLGGALAFVAMLLGALLVFVTWAAAEEYPLVLTHPPEFGLYYVPELAVIYGGPDHPTALAPSRQHPAPLALGQPDAPFSHVYATGYSVAGQPGLNTTIHTPGCTWTIRGGLIVAAVTPFGQPCP